VLGPEELPLDTIAQTVAFRRIAEGQWKRLPVECRAQRLHPTIVRLNDEQELSPSRHPSTGENPDRMKRLAIP
jgi:hypothetical protein